MKNNGPKPAVTIGPSIPAEFLRTPLLYYLLLILQRRKRQVGPTFPSTHPHTITRHATMVIALHSGFCSVRPRNAADKAPFLNPIFIGGRMSEGFLQQQAD
jgi:hypothetical protein